MRYAKLALGQEPSAGGPSPPYNESYSHIHVFSFHNEKK